MDALASNMLTEVVFEQSLSEELPDNLDCDQLFEELNIPILTARVDVA